MSLLNTKVLPALNGRYETSVKSFEEVNNEQGGYVKVVLQLPDREYNYINNGFKRFIGYPISFISLSVSRLSIGVSSFSILLIVFSALFVMLIKSLTDL